MRSVVLPIVSLILFAAQPALGSSVSLGDTGTPQRWATPLVSYWLQQAGSDNLAPEASLAAVRRGFASWVDLECSSVTFEELGDAPDSLSTMLSGAAPNDANELVWLEGDDWSMGSYVLGVTAPWTDDQGHIVEADIAFNGQTVIWTVGGQGGVDLESVAVHEIGHMIGLQHNLGPYSLQEPPTMAPNVAPANKSRSLEADDVGAVCFLYPAAPDGWRCLGDADCPWIVGRDFQGDERYAGRYHCGDAGHCDALELFIAGLSGLGERCSHDSACAAGLWCQPRAGEDGICTLACDPEAGECAEGFLCEPFEPPFAEQGACLPADGLAREPGSGPWGCQSGAVCDSGLLCLPTPAGDRSLCSELCRVGEDGGCPDGKACWSYGRANGGCFDLALHPQPAAPEPGPEAAAEPGPEPTAEPKPEATAETIADAEPEPTPPHDEDDSCSGGATPTPWLGLLFGWWALRRRD